MKEFLKFLEEVLSDPVAKKAFDRAQRQPTPLRINGTEYHRRQKNRSHRG